MADSDPRILLTSRSHLLRSAPMLHFPRQWLQVLVVCEIAPDSPRAVAKNLNMADVLAFNQQLSA